MTNLNNKVTVMPFVTLYRNAFDFSDEILEKMKNWDTEYVEGGLLSPFSPWYTYGDKAEIDPSYQSDDFRNSNPEEYKYQYDLFTRIREVIFDAYEDYIKDWAGKEVIDKYKHFVVDDNETIFGDIVKTWDFKSTYEGLDFTAPFSYCADFMPVDGDEGWTKTAFSIARYKLNNDGKYAIQYHCDSPGEIENPGPKAILTATIYLNDDYEGGEISFLNEVTKEVINYKPRKGDMTVFPSSRPFFHAALPSSGNTNKWFLRNFLIWKSNGTKRYFDGVEKYGAEIYTEITHILRSIESKFGYYTRDVFEISDFKNINSAEDFNRLIYDENGILGRPFIVDKVNRLEFND